MKRRYLKVPEVECTAYEGVEFPMVKQSLQPSRKNYPAPRKRSSCKGRKIVAR
jgi:hypothetical protein